MTPRLSLRERFLGWILYRIEHIHVEDRNQRHARDLQERPDTLRIVILLQNYYSARYAAFVKKKREDYYHSYF